MLHESYGHLSLSLSTRQSRKRKLEEMSLGSSKADFFRRRPLPHVFPRDCSDPAPRSLKISTSLKVSKRSVRRTLPSHTPKKRQSCSRRVNADRIQLASASSDSDRKKDIKKSIAELPKLFTRFFRLGSKSDKSADSGSKCSAMTTDSQTSKSKSHRWTKFMIGLTVNPVLPTSQLSQTPTSVHRPNTTLTSSSRSDPFGDIPSISVPVLQPVPSWRKMHRKYSKKIMKKRFPEPAESSAPLSLPASYTSLSSQSYPFGDVPFTISPVLKPVPVEITASTTPFAQPASTLLKPAPTAPIPSWQQISKLKTTTSSSDPVDVKFCPESARELSHLTGSGLSADSSGARFSPELDSNLVGQFTSTMSGFPQNKMQLASSSRNASDSSSSTLCSSTSCGQWQESKHVKPTHFKTNFVTKPDDFGSIFKTSESEVQPSENEEFFQFTAVSSSFSSSSTIFKNSTETINSINHKRGSMSNLLLADSVSSCSAGWNAENCTNLRGTVEGQFEFIASSSPAVNYNVSHNPNTSGDSSSLVLQSIAVKRRQGNHKFFRKLMSAFSADKLEGNKAEPSVSERKILVRRAKKKSKD